MPVYKADLHIHTLLSPCGDLEMTPAAIIEKAREKNLDLIAITDHNSTRQCALVEKLGYKAGIKVLWGVEVNTKEEVHCLVLLNGATRAEEFQNFMDEKLPPIKNKPELFGYQVVVDEDEMIVYEEPRLLISALKASVDEVYLKAKALDAMVIPAHIDRKANGIFSQLGFLPDNLKFDALELSNPEKMEEWKAVHPELGNFPIITGSDAHRPEEIGNRHIFFEAENLEWKSIRHGIQNYGKDGGIRR